MREIISLTEASKLAKVTKTAILDRARRGRIRDKRIGNYHVFYRKDILNWKEKKRGRKKK